MKVGIVYDLRDDYRRMGFSEEDSAEFDKVETIDAIDAALRRMGYETERIGHVQRLVNLLSSGARWDIVFNISEGVFGVAREAQVPALLDAYQIPYTFSDGLVLALTLHKGMTKRIVRDLGLATPDFVVVESLEDLEKFSLPFPVFAKPVAEGTGKGISALSQIADAAALERVVADLLVRFNQPVLIETFLSGREFTVGVVGTGRAARSLGVMEIVWNELAEGNAYSYFNKQHYEGRVTYRLIEGGIAEDCEKLALAAWRGLGCRDAGRLDIRCDDLGQPHFLEVNPLAGLNPDHSDLCILARLAGYDFDFLIGEIMHSALSRSRLQMIPSQIAGNL